MKSVRDLLKEKSHEIEFWTLKSIEGSRRELYMCQGAHGPEVNQSRMVKANDLFLELWVKRDEQHLGRAYGRILESEPPLPQIEKLMSQARLSSEKKWRPKDLETTVSESSIPMCAPQFLENFDQACQLLGKDVLEEVKRTEGAQFNSAELFCTLERHQRWSSNGFENRSQRSRIYAEVCFSASEGTHSDEFLVTRWAVRPEDLQLHEMCRYSVEGAGGLLRAKQTPAGQYEVLLRSEDLAPIMETYKERVSGGSKYLNMPFYEKGVELIPEFSGQNFNLVVNPAKEWAINSLAADPWGHPAIPLTIAAGNRVENNLYSQKFAQYLSASPISQGGVLEVHPTSADLKGEHALEILQFSGLFVDPMSQTFSSEIRLARQRQKDGSLHFYKGGSLSGSIKGNFSKVRWSKDSKLTSCGGEYSFYGPTAAVLNDVSVS